MPFVPKTGQRQPRIRPVAQDAHACPSVAREALTCPPGVIRNPIPSTTVSAVQLTGGAGRAAGPAGSRGEHEPARNTCGAYSIRRAAGP